MQLVHRVRGVYDVYAVTECDSVIELFDSDCDYNDCSFLAVKSDLSQLK